MTATPTEKEKAAGGTAAKEAKTMRRILHDSTPDPDSVALGLKIANAIAAAVFGPKGELR